MPRYGRLLADAQWERIRPLLPKRPQRPRCGRPGSLHGDGPEPFEQVPPDTQRKFSGSSDTESKRTLNILIGLASSETTVQSTSIPGARGRGCINTNPAAFGSLVACKN